jgi:hypothetical protein
MFLSNTSQTIPHRKTYDAKLQCCNTSNHIKSFLNIKRIKILYQSKYDINWAMVSSQLKNFCTIFTIQSKKNYVNSNFLFDFD